MLFEGIKFILSFGALAISNYYLVVSLEKISWFLKVKKFVIGFLVMGLAVSLPNIFIAIYSAGLEVPKLSLGEIYGGNILLLSFALGAMALISKNGLALKCKLVKKTSIYIFAISLFLLLLTLDNMLCRIDGVILIITFFAYFSWIFAKKERFRATYTEKVKIAEFIKNLVVFLLSLFFLIVSTFFIVNTSIFFADEIGLDLWLIGLLVVSLFGALPELIFGIHAAKAEEDELVIGNIIGSVIGSFTLVLGILILIYPIKVSFLFLLPIQIFMIISALSFFLFSQTKNVISAKEGYILLIVYFTFLFHQIFSIIL